MFPFSDWSLSLKWKSLGKKMKTKSNMEVEQLCSVNVTRRTATGLTTHFNIQSNCKLSGVR